MRPPEISSPAARPQWPTIPHRPSPPASHTCTHYHRQRRAIVLSLQHTFTPLLPLRACPGRLAGPLQRNRQYSGRPAGPAGRPAGPRSPPRLSTRQAWCASSAPAWRQACPWSGTPYLMAILHARRALWDRLRRQKGVGDGSKPLKGSVGVLQGKEP